jgi:H+/Cl- antiporter ClcA
LRKLLDTYRRRLTNYESVLAYSLLGILGGLASGIVVLGFEWAIVEFALLFGVGGGGEDFESLPRWLCFALPLASAIVLGLAYALLKPETREVGIVHVLSRMDSHYGALPLRNAVVQFTAGSFALATGQSGGREGPGVHLGAAVNSLLGQRLGLPNNSLRILIACGTAGGIAAAFHTPLAGVIFAMEVIIAEYTVVGFIPVMLAAVSASAISRILPGSGTVFTIPPTELKSLMEIPFIVFLGFCCGLAVTGFIKLSSSVSRLSNFNVALRFTGAGLVTACMALWVPQVLGIGYDTLNEMLGGELAISLLVTLGACKLIATAIGSGAGLPIGIIGPSLLIGACIGSILSVLGRTWQPELASDHALYVVIGMGATMGAILNAPLAAILAVIELTGNIVLGMPAMLAIVTSTLTTTGIFGQSSVHQSVLGQLQRRTPDDPLSKMLHRTDVTSIMDQRAVRVPCDFSPEDLEPLLEFTPTWCIVARDAEDLYLVSGADLLAWLQARDADKLAADLTEADIRRWTLTQVPVQATLRQAVDGMRTATAEAVSVYERSARTGNRILQGVVTRESIEKYTLSKL